MTQISRASRKIALIASQGLVFLASCLPLAASSLAQADAHYDGPYYTPEATCKPGFIATEWHDPGYPYYIQCVPIPTSASGTITTFHAQSTLPVTCRALDWDKAGEIVIIEQDCPVPGPATPPQSAAVKTPIRQAKPKHWYKSGKFWGGEAFMLGALAANAVSGCHAGRYGDDIVRYYNGPQELPFFQSYHQSCAQIKDQTAALAAAYTLGHIGLYRMTENSHSRTVRFLGAFGLPIVAAGVYGTQARKNYGNLN